MRALPVLALLGMLGLPIAHLGAQPISVTSDPVGFNIVPCLPNSDTIVGVPFRQMGSFQATLDSDPQADGDEATLPLRGPFDLTENELANTHYVKFTSGPLDGRWFTITGNDEDTLYIDLNGDSLSTTAEGDSLLVAKFWTLDSLFPPDQATTTWTESPEGSGNFIPNGHAIVASLGNFAFQRRTELIFPDTEAIGSNNPPQVISFLTNNRWIQSVANFPEIGAKSIAPDSFFIIRHLQAVSHATNYRSSGEVHTGLSTTQISTLSNGSQDNFVTHMRPIDVKLKETGLYTGDDGAFVSSAGNFAFQRRDELLVFENTSSAIRRSPSAIYFHNGENWIRSVSGFPTADDDVIPAGYGFILRKAPTPDGSTKFWNNPGINQTN